MRICVLARGIPETNSPFNGLYEWNFAKLLKKCGYDVTYIAVDMRFGGDKIFGKKEFSYEDVDIVYIGVPTLKTTRVINVFVRKRLVLYAINKQIKAGKRPDLIWGFFGRVLGTVAAFVGKKLFIPYAVTECDKRLCKRVAANKIDKRLVKIYANARIKAIANPCLKDAYSLRYSVDFAVIPQPIFVDFLREKQKNETFAFLSIGAYFYENGFDILLRAYSIFQRNGYDTKLVICGKGEEERRLKELAERLALKKVEFVELTDGARITKLMRESDALCLTPRTADDPTLILKGMSEGLPCLVTNTIASSVVGPGTGVVVNPSACAVARGLTELYERKDLFNADRIKNQINDVFSQGAVFRKIRRIIADNLQ